MSRATAWGTYARIAEAIRGRITHGDLMPGALLPSEAALCVEFAVVRNTVRRAFAVLEGEGLVEALPGKGRVVCGDAPNQCAYRRIADDLRSRIENGRLAAGDALPSESTIVEEYGVARGTARTAFALLENEGLIEVRRGKGRYVVRGISRLVAGVETSV